METPERDIGYLELARGNTNFRRLWIADIVSLLGDWFNTIAIYSIVEALTGSPFALGLVFIAKMLPFALASPLAGLIADRFDRRRLMIGADFLRAVIVLGFLTIDSVDELGLLYVLTALQVIVGAVFIPARSASIPNIVTDRELLTANALLSATWSVLLAVGAALGGFAAEWLGTDTVFLIDSATYLVSAFFVYRTVIPQRTDPSPDGPMLQSAVRQVAAGWRHMRTHPRVGRIALAKTAWAAGGSALVYMLTMLGEAITPGRVALGIGILFSLRGLGTGIGPILARAWFKHERTWPLVMGWCIVVSGLFYFSVGVLPWTWAAGVGLLVMCAHIPSGANWVLSSVMLQARTADAFRGRVFATEWLMLTLLDAVAIFVAGVLLESRPFGFDLRDGFRLFAGIQICCGLAWLVFVVPREREEAVEVAAPGRSQ